MTRCYSELSKLNTFEERFNYLRLKGTVGADTFGFDRYLNQRFYRSPEWKTARRDVIIRDNGCDLGVEGYELYNGIYVHHMNPISPNDLIHGETWIYDPEYLICVSFDTHQAIHYGDDPLPHKLPIKRTMNDTCPWLL